MADQPDFVLGASFARRTLLRAMAAGAVVPAVGLPAMAEAAETPVKGGSLVILVTPEPASLAAYMSVAANVPQITAQIYEGLVTYDWDQKPIPKLAKSWEIAPDGLTVTFHLQEGVKFHNGEPFTSADVQYTFMEVLKKVHPRGPVVLKAVTSISTPDPLTAVFHLDHPAPYMMMALSGADAPILCRKLFEGVDPANNPTANKPIGTGPFRFTGWERGQYVRMDRNPNYWQPGLPYLDRVVARFIPDASTRSAAVEAGEAQFAAYNSVNFSDVARLKANPTLEVTTRGYEMFGALSELELNSHKPPFDKKEVRQAIAYAIDRKFIVDNIQYGYGRPATGPIVSANKRFYSNDVRHFDVPDRLEIANKLMDQAGLPKKADGMRFSATIEVNPFGVQWQRQAEYLKQALAQIGIDLSLRNEDVGAWLRRVYTNYDYEISEPFFSNLADPVLGVQRQYVTSQIRKGVVFVNDTFYSKPEVDTLFDQAAVEMDETKRAALYKQLQQILVEDSPVIWLTEVDFVTVYNKKLHNAVVGPLGAYMAFERAWLEH